MIEKTMTKMLSIFKRPFLGFFLALLVVGSLSRFCLAQDFNFQKAYEDYLYNFNLYRAAHLEYIGSKSEYLTYQTLEAQTKALEKTRKMLSSRNQVLITYLTALRIKLAEVTGIENYEQNIHYLRLDDQISFVKLNDQKLPSPASLEDLLKVSSEVEQKFPEAEALSYQTLGTIISTPLANYQKHLEQEVEKLEEKVSEMRSLGEETATIERWLIDVKEKISLSKKKHQEGKNELLNIKASDQDKKGKWLFAQKKLEESNQYLKEAISYLREIMKKIKYG